MISQDLMFCRALIGLGMLTTAAFVCDGCRKFSPQPMQSGGQAGADDIVGVAGQSLGGAGAGASPSDAAGAPGGMSGALEPRAGAGGEPEGGGGSGQLAELEPRDFPGLVLWLEAAGDSCIVDAQKLQSCVDRSGTHNDAKATPGTDAPLLVEKVVNQHAALHFGGRPSLLTIDDDASLWFGTGEFSVVMVARSNNSPTFLAEPAYGGCGVVLLKANAVYPFAGIALFANYPQYTSALPAMTRFAAQLAQGDAFALSARSHLNDGIFRVYSVRRRSGSELELRINGQADARSRLEPGLDVSAQAQPLVLGGNPDQPFDGDIAELAMIKGAVSDDDIGALERHLSTKYALSND